jgi:hypothetical protein
MRHEPTLCEIGSALAATYTRAVRAGIERIWENVLDWEHLSALHEIYFDHVALIEVGSWGWRVVLTKTPGTTDCPIPLELQVERTKARYHVRILAGDGMGTLIEALGPQRTAVEVRFICPSAGRRG